ncbi:endonuclease MutS2 [Alicyclobacillus sendaiensis]|uniref:Endonuclease MutS2 n=1 Tax=Alicyclobacillus sendaiensis PA2 TaxID=3029425 RepID=A0ABT6XZQ6_ALISE|nr:endonuclease MutS2 [Alicyclobacillus sendaiensis]MDI9260563.1 endonuclease MutS2 [Alicyclobacillus sendaiensis PA2]
MDERALDALEYDDVRGEIAQCAQTSLGQARASAMVPFAGRAEAEAELARLDEAVRMLYRVGAPPFAGIEPLQEVVERARRGGTISADEANRLARCIAGMRAMRQFVERAAEGGDFPLLASAVAPMVDLRRTEQEIRQVVDEDGQVLDHASLTLLRLRDERRRREAEIRAVLERLLRTQAKYLQEPVIAMRGDHYCLPVRVEHKSQIPGMVRDVSSSGSTVYIEPRAVVELSERVRELEVLEEREVERLLYQLAAAVAQVADEFLRDLDVAGEMDFLFAKAAYARRVDGKRPRLTEGVWRLHGARHPKLRRDAVPIDVELGDRFRLLIITGPNTGGKTVTLKTIGLLTLMGMSGLFLPTKRESDIGFCSHVFVDIGDEQSIEQNLSTFSSHMRRIIDMLERVTPDSLVLLDELGAGTDPAEGSALAIAILDHLASVGARVVATTHYAELKGYAFRNPAAQNASMEFDVETLRPTYRLLMGVPGRSNALAIAERLGMPKEILERARSHVAESDIHVEELIGKLESASRAAERMRDEAERALQEARDQQAHLAREKAAWEASKDAMREKAAREAREVIEQARREADAVIREIRSLRDKAVVKDHELVELRKRLEAAEPEEKRATSRRRGHAEVRPGQRVRVLSLGQKGDVVEVAQDGRAAVVQLGAMRMKVDARDLEVVGDAEPVAAPSVTRIGSAKDVRMELDVRGETVDDALSRIDKYLDDAVVAGISRVVIIHGKGTGALRNAIRRYLRDHPHVKSSAPAGPGEGGDGATVVHVRTT